MPTSAEPTRDARPSGVRRNLGPEGYWAFLMLLLVSLAQLDGTAKSAPTRRVSIVAAYGPPCVDYSASFFDLKTHHRIVHTALGYCYPRTPSIEKLFVLMDGVAYADFHYKKGEMTTTDAKMLIDVNTPRT
jgi:hypothetical protein